MLWLIAHRKHQGDQSEYRRKEQAVRNDTHLPDDPAFFLEVRLRNSSDFSDVLPIHGMVVGAYQSFLAKRILRH